jgi:hypothetical protein
MNKFKRHLTSIVVASGMLIGGGLVVASPASASGDPYAVMKPVCYYKSSVRHTSRDTIRVTNVVTRQEVLQYPAHTKRCYITQTYNVKRKHGRDGSSKGNYVILVKF